MGKGISRRGVLRTALAGACSAAAHPLWSTVTLAAAPWDARLVVIVLRGGMDGLDVVQPWGDPLLRQYRPTLETGPGTGMADLDGFFGLHPRLAGLKPLWDAGELGFVHAVSTPYRDKRSHFDGQDLLEAGTGPDALEAARGGWLNRFLAGVPGAEAETAFAVGNDEMRILAGAAPAARWSPSVDFELTPQAELLLEHIYAPDPLFRPAAAEAMRLAAMIDRERLAPLANGERRDPVAAFVADRLAADTRIAAFSVTGWDTHRRQDKGLVQALGKLERALMTLHEGLGGVWAKTLVLAMTEFGRTVAENGTRGTDHGTGGAMVLAGGALRGGRVYGRWPGLEEAELYDQRDLMPTDDLRRHAAWALRGLYGAQGDVLERVVFPGLDLGRDPGFVA